MKLTGFTKAFGALILNLMLALFLGVAIEQATAPAYEARGETTPFTAKTVAITYFALATFMQLGFMRQNKKQYAFAIQQEFWVDVIAQNLFKSNAFMNKCYDASSHVLKGSVVHLPQAGAKPTVVKNRTIGSLGTNVTRTDTDITYALNVYTTDPTLITDAEAMEVSYDKMASVLQEHLETLGETISDDLLIQWCLNLATGNILRTTGGAVATALAPSATGTRLKFLKEDLARAQTLFNKQNISSEDRYALFPSDLMSQLKEDADLKQRDFGMELNLKDGTIGKLYGFNLMERSSTPVFTNATPPLVKALGAAGAATDNLAAICWQKNSVEKALGTIKFFEAINDPNGYGDIYSALVKMGGRSRRTNNEGICAIVQA